MLMWVSRIAGTWRWTRSSSMSRRTKASGAGQMSQISGSQLSSAVHTIINGQRHQKRYIMFHTKSTGRNHLKQIIIDSIYWYNWNFNNQIRLQSEKTRLGNAIRRLVSFAVDIYNQRHQEKRGRATVGKKILKQSYSSRRNKPFLIVLTDLQQGAKKLCGNLSSQINNMYRLTLYRSVGQSSAQYILDTKPETATVHHWYYPQYQAGDNCQTHISHIFSFSKFRPILDPENKTRIDSCWCIESLTTDRGRSDTLSFLSIVVLLSSGVN